MNKHLRRNSEREALQNEPKQASIYYSVAKHVVENGIRGHLGSSLWASAPLRLVLVVCSQNGTLISGTEGFDINVPRPFHPETPKRALQDLEISQETPKRALQDRKIGHDTPERGVQNQTGWEHL